MKTSKAEKIILADGSEIDPGHILLTDEKYQEDVNILHALQKKRDLVNQEIASLSQSMALNEPIKQPDKIQQALGIEPGVRSRSLTPKAEQLERLTALNQQSTQLETAIRDHVQRVNLEEERAGRRLFATEAGDTYRAAVSGLVDAVERLMAANGRVGDEWRALVLRGVHVPDCRFPLDGAWELMPDWHKALVDLQAHLNHLAGKTKH